MTSVIQRGVRCPACKEDIYSNSPNDLVYCKCKSVFIDGGQGRFRFGGVLLESIEPVSRIVAGELPEHFRDEPQHSLTV